MSDRNEPDGVFEVVSGGETATIRYFETSGIPKSANIEILDDDIGIELVLGVGVHHRSNVPDRVAEAVRGGMDSNITTLRATGDVASRLEDAGWDVEDTEVSQ